MFTSLLASSGVVSDFSLVQRLWLALLSPCLLAFCVLLSVVSRRPRNRHLLSMLISLLDFSYLPSVQIGIAALGCSDSRDPEQRYLNLTPWQACDAEWRATLLFPALVLVFLLGVLAPVGIGAAMWRYRAEIPRNRNDGSFLFAGVFPSLNGFKPHRRWWLLVLLLRRLLLATTIAIVPYYSALLPLLIVLLLQLSAVAQQFVRPFVQYSSNLVELASLYLLLVSYFTVRLSSCS